EHSATNFDVDFDEDNNDPRAGAISPPPPVSGAGINRTNTTTSNSSGKDRSSLRASTATYRPTSVLSANTGMSAGMTMGAGGANGKGNRGSSFKIFGGKQKKDAYTYGLESPTESGGADYDNDGYVEDDMEKSLDFEKLIQSGQTMKVTLTPNRLRTIEVKDQPSKRSPNTSTWSQRAPPVPQKSTSTSSVPPPMPEKRVNFAPPSANDDDDDDDGDYDEEFPMGGGRRKGGKEESIFDFLRNTAPDEFGKPATHSISPTRNTAGPLASPRYVPIVTPQPNSDTSSKLNKLSMNSPTRGPNTNMTSVDRPFPPPASPRSPQQSPQDNYPTPQLRPALKRDGSGALNSNSSGRSDSPLRPRPPASLMVRSDEEDEDDDDLDDLTSDGLGARRRNKRVSYMSETSTLIDFLSSTPPPAGGPAVRPPVSPVPAAAPPPTFNTRQRSDSAGKKFVKIEIPKVESIEKMLKDKQDSPKLPTEYKLPPGYQPVRGAGITGMKVPDGQAGTGEEVQQRKEEEVVEAKVEEKELIHPTPSRSRSPVGSPRSSSLADRKVKFEQEAAPTENGDVKGPRRKLTTSPSPDDRSQQSQQQQSQQSAEPERPSARTRFDPTVNGTVNATPMTAEPESLPEGEQGSEIVQLDTRRERPPSMVAKRASLFNTLATQENITISAKEIHSLRRQLTSANSVEMSVQVWDDFLHKNGGAVRRRGTVRRANLTESEEEHEQQLLDAGANSDEGSGHDGSGRDSAGSERSNEKSNAVLARARRFEQPKKQQAGHEKMERSRAAEAIAAAREKREARRSLIMLANSHPPKPVTVEIAIQTDFVEPETVAVVVTKVEGAGSKGVPEVVAGEQRHKAKTPMLVLSAENEDGSVIEQEVELSDVETEEEKGVVIGDEEWFLDADEEWEDDEADEALVAEWLLGEAVLAF
ncbi:hypothetical protein BC936DRAFT_142069, partial [Jimgerdemannia flammicorona]